MSEKETLTIHGGPYCGQSVDVHPNMEGVSFDTPQQPMVFYDYLRDPNDRTRLIYKGKTDARGAGMPKPPQISE